MPNRPPEGARPAEAAGRTRLRDAPWALAALGLAVLGGAVLRLRGLGAPSLWTDELVSWWAASAPSLGEVVARSSACMATPPLSFLAEHVSVGILGAGEVALRLPSALAGIASIGVVGAAGWRMFSPRAGAFAALFLAVHPFHLWYSTDGRPYGLAILLAAGSTWALSETFRAPRIGFLSAYALCTAALLYAQFIFLPLLAAHAAAMLLLWWRAALPPAVLGRAAGALAGAGLLALPLAPQMLSVAGRASALTWPFPGSFPPGIYRFFQTTPLVTAVLVYLAFAWARGEAPGLRPSEESPARRSDLLALTLAFLLPALTLGVLGTALDLPSLLKPRYGAAYLVPCALLAGWGVSRPAWPAGRRILAATYLGLIVVTHVAPTLRDGKSFNQNAQSEDWRAASELLGAHLQPGDLVLFRSGLIEVAGLYDGTYPESCAGYLAAPLSDLYLGEDPEAALLPPQFAERPYPMTYLERFGGRLEGRSRVWFVMLNPPDPGGYYRSVVTYVREVSGRPFRLARSGNFGPITVALLRSDG